MSAILAAGGSGGSNGIPAPTVANGASLAVTPAMSNGNILFERAAGSHATLPAATGTGGRYTFIVVTALSGGNYVVSTASSADTITGTVIFSDQVGLAMNADYAFNVSGADTLTWNGTTTGGGGPGDWAQFTDIAANSWQVSGLTYKATASPTTMFTKV